MLALRDALSQYLTLRRALGTQLLEPAARLADFVDFLERKGARCVTTQLAIQWAMQPERAQPETWA